MRKTASGLAVASVVGLFVWSMSVVVRSNDAPVPQESSAQEASAPVTEATVTDKCSSICTSSTGCNRACLDNSGKQITCGQWGTCFLCSKCTTSTLCTKPCLKAGTVTTCKLGVGVCKEEECQSMRPGFDYSPTIVGPGFPVTFKPRTTFIKPGSDVNWDWGDTKHQFTPANTSVTHTYFKQGTFTVLMGSTNTCNQSVLSDPGTVEVKLGAGAGSGEGSVGDKQRDP